MKKIRLAYLRLILTALVAAALGVVLAPVIAKLYGSARALTTVKHEERDALAVLKQEYLHFLVTDRIASHIVVESEDSNPVLGKKEGYLIAKAKLYYGIDMDKLTEQDLVRTNGVIIVNLPEPEALDFAVDLESMRFISKRSGLMVIADWIMNADQEAALRRQFKAAALEYMANEGLIPSKESIIRRLTDFAAVFSDPIGARVVFK